jgi:UDP:flavonoid glycosyltransferase YjiC (YdhE family)
VRILLASHGTRGDVQPMIALAIALRRRGHNVRFVTPANFVGWIRGLGFACESDGIDVEEVLRRPDIDVQSFRSQMQYFKTLAPQLFDATARASAGAEIIVGSGVQLAGMSIAELRGVPYVNAIFCPCVVPGSTAPPIRWQTLPSWANRLIWRVGLPILDALLRGPINACRVQLGLARVDHPVSMLADCGIVLAADRELAPLPPDAPSTVVQTDAWILDDPAALDPEVDAFLRAGPAPIYIGFGSMVANDLDRIASSIAGAARVCDCRMIVSSGWAALHDRLPASDRILVIQSAPHRALFPRVAAIVHHGGAGTTRSATGAGVPQVILPHLLDQYYWARRIEVLGLGPASVPVERVTPQSLAERIDVVLHDERCRTRARELGARVAVRDGTAAGVEYLESPHVHRRA